MNKKRTAPAAAALMLAVAALFCSVLALVRSQRAEEHAYSRVVTDIWTTLVPVYKDFGLQLPDRHPATVREALEPLFKMTTSLQGGDL